VSFARASDEKVLSNQDVTEMLKSLPADIVAAKIKSSHCNFATEVTDLKALKEAGVPDNVVLAMVQAAHYAIAPKDGKIRVFVTDSQSWEVRGGWGAANGSGGGAESGGARPQTAEIIKTLTERCPEVTVTNRQDMANYAVTLDHEGGKERAAQAQQGCGIPQRWRCDFQQINNRAGKCSQGRVRGNSVRREAARQESVSLTGGNSNQY